MSKSILIIVTSCKQTPKGDATGVWLDEYTIPYNIFKNNSMEITVASVDGGQAPIDPRSKPSMENQILWAEALDSLNNTLSVSEIDPENYDAVYFPGGHGTMFDLPNNSHISRILNYFQERGKLIAAVCHGPACFIGATLSDGKPLIADRILTSFSNDEEIAAGHDSNMPFLLETQLLGMDAQYKKLPEWSDHIEIDHNIITGQNPQSSKSVADAMMNYLTVNQ